MSHLYVMGEPASTGQTLVRSHADGKLYRAGGTGGTLIGEAAEELREGFRVVTRDGLIYEDDA